MNRDPETRIACQVEYLLDLAAASAGSNAELVVLDVAAVGICGNGICEIGERPVANTSTAVGSEGDLFLSISRFLRAYH